MGASFEVPVPNHSSEPNEKEMTIKTAPTI